MLCIVAFHTLPGLESAEDNIVLQRVLLYTPVYVQTAKVPSES